MKVTITSGELTAEIESLGAEPVGVKYKGVERLWQNENGAWAGHAPVLFPICGACTAVFGGKTSSMTRHGFARRSEFTLTERGENFVKFTLTDSEDTRALYPFAFILRITYIVKDSTLEIVYEAENPAEEVLPFAWGGHVSHALFSPLGGHTLMFSEEEDLAALEHDEYGHLTGEICNMGTGKTLLLTEDTFSNSHTVIFANINSRKVTLHSPQGALAELAFEGFSNLLLWRPLDSEMICVEPWSNLPDPADMPRNTELSEKGGVINLPAGKTARARQKLTYFAV